MTQQDNRRDLLKAGVQIGCAGALAALCGPVGPLFADEPDVEPAALAAERERRKWRRRRLIMNNDGCDAMVAGADTLEGFLSQRDRPILNSQVDSIFYCTGATTMFTHQAQVGETYGSFVRDDSEAMARHARHNISALHQLGHDTLAATAQFCHEHDLEVFFTHRINDIHDTSLDWERSTWKREHPEYWITTQEDAAQAGGGNSPRHWWSALDFAKPEVLDYLYAIQRDVTSRYDLDGVEIDYFRSPMFFQPNLDYEPATSAQVEILTAFQRQMRTIAYRAGTKRGRPLLMSTRVPATPGCCRHVGIDIERWLQEGLLDVLTVGGGYVPFTEPLDEMVALARQYKVPIYATISASGMKPPYNIDEAWRGAAANMWHAGVDGIVLFNYFPSEPTARINEIGSPETLRGLDKVFAIDQRRILEGDLVQGIEQRQVLPIPIPADGSAATAILPIGDDLAAAGRDGRLQSAELWIELNNADALSDTQVDLNGQRLTAAGTEGAWIRFDPQPNQYRLGSNVLAVRAGNAVANTESLADIVHVETRVKYG